MIFYCYVQMLRQPGSEPYRKFGPCVDKSQWNELMQQTGFSGLDVALSDYDDIRSHEQSVLISSADRKSVV